MDRSARVFPLSLRRIFGMVRRHFYLLRGSLPRILEMAYWPTVQMVIWGFVTQFFMGHSSWVANAAGILIGAVLLWDLLFRSQIGFSMCFLEEMWSRNLGHLFVSPLRPYELIISMMLISFLRGIVGLLPSWILAFVFFEFSIFSYGVGIVAFFSCLFVMGWGLGMAVRYISPRHSQHIPLRTRRSPAACRRSPRRRRLLVLWCGTCRRA